MTFHVRRPDGTMIGELAESEFRRRIFANEIVPEDYYWCEGMADWATVSSYHVPAPVPQASVPDPAPPKVARGSGMLARVTTMKKKNSPASIGGMCAVAAVFAPLVNGSLFFLASLPLLIAAFVLAIVSLVQLRILAGIFLLAGLVIAGPMSCSMLVDREKWLHDPGAFAREQKEKEAAEHQRQQNR